MHALASAVTLLQLVLSPDAAFGGVPLHEIAREVREIWASHLTVAILPPGTPNRIDALTLQLRTADEPHASAVPQVDSMALGWIDFVDGQPQPVVTVSVARARSVAARAVVAGRQVRQLPSSVGQRLTAVALGRAIAHEIGHYVLESTIHTRTGLMRAGFGPDDVTARGVGRFGLSADERRRLRARLAAPVWATAWSPQSSACPSVPCDRGAGDPRLP